MKKYIQFTNFLCLFCFRSIVVGQDFGFTQYPYTPFINNIAAIANSNEMRVTFNYRFQEAASLRPFSTPMLSFSYPLINQNNKRWGGVGASIINDRTTNFISTFGAIGGFAYNFHLSNKNKLSIGAQLGYLQRNVDLANLKTTSQFTGITTDNGEVNITNGSTNFMNIGTGAMFYQEDFYHNPTNIIGISALNINQPNTAFGQNNTSAMPLAIIANAGWKVWGNEKIAIIPNIKYDYRLSLHRANIGASMRYFIQNSIIQNGYVGFSLWYNTNEALSAMIELNQPNYIVALSYDFVTSASRQAWISTGAPEITLIYKKAIVRKCKDSDKDGVCDKDDQCVNEPGVLALKGCPDKDKDGIADHKDECPDQPGLAKFTGCPDKDLDNIPDKLDDCPEIAGLEKYKGCPDTDLDGIPDIIDKCPTVAGIVALQGCPEPVVENEIQQLLPENSLEKIPFVQFDRKVYIINKEFLLILDKIVLYAKNHPKAKFVLEGHTDNIGSLSDNVILSKNRVNAVYTYLTKNGITNSQISTDVHGENRPISANETEEGRTKNRRVEIRISE